MDEPSSAVAESKPQPDARAPQSQPAQAASPQNSSSQTPPDSEARYQRRDRLLSNPRTRWALIIAGLIVLVGVFFLWRYLASYESTDDAEIDGHVSPISARVSGHVIKLNVQDNQYVEKGTVLVEIDPTDYQVAVEKARADYEDAKAQASAAGINIPITHVTTSSQVSGAEAGVSGAKAGISSARQQLDAAKAQVAQADANNIKAQSDLVRYKLLIDKQEISEQQYDQAVAAAHAAAAALQSARSTADAYSAQVQQAQDRLRQAQADLRNANSAPQTMRAIRARALSAEANADQKKAALDQAELNLQYTKVIAPISGAVSNRTVEVGQNVQVGQEMMSIIPLDEENLWVTADFKETQLREMKPGLRVDIHVDATDKTYKGHVNSIAGASGSRFSLLPPENATGNYVKVVQRIPVKIVFDRGVIKNHELRPGMSVEPKVWIK
ncbi:MAG: HlyD family efflux transporter periplasmic adaptor subunit [Terriglobales bacterium]